MAKIPRNACGTQSIQAIHPAPSRRVSSVDFASRISLTLSDLFWYSFIVPHEQNRVGCSPAQAYPHSPAEAKLLRTPYFVHAHNAIVDSGPNATTTHGRLTFAGRVHSLLAVLQEPRVYGCAGKVMLAWYSCAGGCAGAGSRWACGTICTSCSVWPRRIRC